MDNTKQLREIQCLSLCTGYGGIEKGLNIAGVRHRTVAYVEIEAFAISNLVAAMEASAIYPAPIWTNLKTFDGRKFCNKVDIITGGYPCQPFSNAGQRKGSEDPRHLWPYIRKIVKTVKPIWCFFENVEGHLSMGYDQVYRDLRDLGYSVEAGIFSSSEAGGSHQRKRLFILAKLANDQCNGQTRETSERMEQGRDEVGNSNSPKCKGLQKRKEPEQSIFGQPGKTMADSQSKRLERFSNNNGKERREESNRRASEYCRVPIAPPGQFQYEWEHPRQNTKEALKSALGLSIDGYDFRTDLLRSLGNGVDPWAAAKAWEVLYNKLNRNEKKHNKQLPTNSIPNRNL